MSMTEYAPGERAARADLAKEGFVLSRLPHLRGAFDAVPQPFMVLNAHRQIVLANRALLRLAGASEEEAIGRRPGELLACQNASRCASGCGTSRFCRNCGAVNAILGSQQDTENTAECRVAQESGVHLDLRVSAAPFHVDGQSFTLFSISDVGDERRRRALERVFFHDVLNTVGNLRSLAQLVAGAGPEALATYRPLLLQLAEELSSQIQEQRDLAAAERGELAVRVSPLGAGALLGQVGEAYRSLAAARGVTIRTLEGAGDLTIRTDGTLLRRVVGNMVKNAVEASKRDATVTLGFEPTGSGVRFWVHNEGAMAPEVQEQVFQRSFSTKGEDRGLGTYSMRLLAELHLGGRVSFTTDPAQGTCFEVVCPREFGEGGR